MSVISGAAAAAAGGGGSVPPANLPDLIVTAVRWSENDGTSWHQGVVQSGADVWFEADIQNQGAGATPSGETIAVTFKIDGVIVSESDNHSTSLGASQSVSIRANTGPDADKYWTVGSGGTTYDLVVTVDPDNTLAEENNSNNTYSAQIDAEGGDVEEHITVGDMAGAGNILFNDSANASYKVPDLAVLHCGMGRVRSDSGQYYNGGNPNPAAHDSDCLLMLSNGIRPFFSLFHDGNTAAPMTYATWFSIGQAFATRWRPGSSFLQSQGYPNLGAYGYSAVNEPDAPISMSTTNYHNVLEGLADGVKSVDPTAKVFPAGYLGPNRDQDFTCGGYLTAVADLINDGTLDGFDLHTYHSRTGAKIHDVWNRSHQSNMDNCLSTCGINNRADLLLICTETNIRNGDLAGQDYAGLYPSTGLTNLQVARNWYLTSFFDVMGCVRSDGSIAAGGPRFPWQLWRQGVNQWYMADNTTLPIQRGHTGTTNEMLMNLLNDMHFTSATPRTTGVYKLKGGGKSAWVFQNIHTSWTSLFGNTFTISDIPAATTQVQVYDGNGLIQTVSTPTLQIPSHGFSTHRTNYPANMGKSLLFVGNAE